MPPDLRNSRKRILVRPHRIDGLLSSSGNAVVTAIAFIRTVGCVIRPFQLGKINVLTRNVLHWRIGRFAERQGVAGVGNYTARDRYDNASGIALDGDRMIWTWRLDLLFFHVRYPLVPMLSPQKLCDVLTCKSTTRTPGPGLLSRRRTAPVVYVGGGYSLFTSRLLAHVHFRSISFKANFSHG